MKPWEFFFANHAMKIDLLASAVLKTERSPCSLCIYIVHANIILGYN